jgi:putative oxidoreductase
MNSWLPLIGRVLMCALFVKSTYGKITDFDGLITKLSEKGMPMPTELAWLVVAMELVFTVMVLVGYKTRIAAFGLIIWLVPVSFVMHPPSDDKQIGAFLKNLSIIGGLLYIARSGAGQWAVERIKYN